MHERNGNVHARRLQETTPQFYYQGTWLFGNWDKALDAAGFSPDKMRLHKFWDREKVIKGIQHLQRQNEPLHAHYVMKTYSDLFGAGQRYYGQWSKALHAAGITGTPLLKNSTARRKLPEALRDALKRNSRSVISKSLKLQAELYFGSVQKALVASKAVQ
jgi:hypothetical protein